MKLNIGDKVKVDGTSHPRCNFLGTIIDVEDAIISVRNKHAITLSYKRLYDKSIVCYKIQWPYSLGISWELAKDVMLKFPYDFDADFQDKIKDRMS